MHSQRVSSPYLVLGIGILAVSTASLFVRLGQADGIPSIVIAAGRLTLASLILTPPALLRYREEIRRLTRRDLGLMISSGVLLAIHFASWITSLEYTPVLVSVVLVSTAPLWVALLSPLLLHEALTRRVLFGIVIAFAGAILISLSTSGDGGQPDSNPLLGSALALLGAVSVALYLMIGRRVRAKTNLIPYIWLVYGAAAATLLLAVWVRGDSLSGYPSEGYLWILLLALVPQLFGHSSFNYALGHLPAAFVSLVTFGEPVGSAILAFLLLQEVPTPLQIAGAALILGAVIYAQRVELAAQSGSP